MDNPKYKLSAELGKKVQEAFGVPVEELTLAKLMLAEKFQKEETLFSTVVATKVLDTVIRAAEYGRGEGQIWRSASRFVTMDGPTIRIPKSEGGTKDAVRHGGGAGATSEREYGYTTLDVSNDLTSLHRIPMVMSKSAVKDCEWGLVEDEAAMGGEALNDDANYDLVNQFDTMTTTSYITSHWATLLNGRKALKDIGFFPDTIVLGTTGEVALLSLQQFIDLNQMDRAGQIVKSGQIGRIFNMDVYCNHHVDNLPAEGGKAIWGLIYEKAKAVAFGLRQDVEAEEVNDVMAWLQGNHLSMRYDSKIVPYTVAGATVYAGRQLLAA